MTALPWPGPLAVWFVLLVLGGGSAGAVQAGPPEDPGPPVPDDRRPVLVVPGWGDEATDVEPLRARFLAEGWTEREVMAVGFRNPVGSNQENAREVGLAVRRLLGLTGAGEIDIVAHSMGGLAVREYLRTADPETDGPGEVGAEVVRRVVFLGTPHRGTVAAVLAWGDGGREMVPGSHFLTRLNDQPGVPEGVEALAIRTPLDLRVIPASSGRLHGPTVENLEICCPTHTGLADDDRTFEEVLKFFRHGPLEEGPGRR